MNDAKYAANFFAAHSDNIYHACVYEDGLLLYVVCSEVVAQQWVADLRWFEKRQARFTVAHARSDDGLASCFVLRGNPNVLRDFAYAIGERLHADWGQYATMFDDADIPPHTVDSFLALARRAAEG
jgi:hypothetical protein